MEIGKIDLFYDVVLNDLYQKSVKEGTVKDLFNLGFALNAREYLQEARTVLELALDKDTDDNLIWYELIFSIGQESTMQKLVERVETTFPDDNSFIRNRNLALIYHYLGESDKANICCKKFMELEGKDFTAYEVNAYLLFWENDFDRALVLVRKSLDVNNRSIRSWRLLGHCFFEKGNFDKAEEAYRKAVELDPMYVRGWYSLGQLILNKKERFQEGLRCLTKAMYINPSYWNSYFTLIDFYLGNKMYPEAIGECRKILNLSPDIKVAAEAYNYLGMLQYNQGEHRQALGNFKKALELKQESALPDYYIGQIYFKNEEFDKAIEHFDKAIEYDSSFAWPHTQSGFALVEKKKYSDALKRFQRALELDPDEYWAYMGIADVYRKKRNPKRQMEVMQKAAGIAGNDSDVLNRLAIAYECNNMSEQAEIAYLKALELDPYNRKAANNLGYLYEKLYQRSGDNDLKEKAIETWKKRLIICRDDGSSMKGAIAHLEKLGVRKSLIDKWIEIGELGAQ